MRDGHGDIIPEGFYDAPEHDDLELIQSEYAKLHTIAQEIAEALENIQELCLCERFKTKGFNYGEKHPVRGKCDDGRWLTPSVIAEIALTNWNKYKEQE